jgi:hypothetical protein
LRALLRDITTGGWSVFESVAVSYSAQGAVRQRDARASERRFGFATFFENG